MTRRISIVLGAFALLVYAGAPLGAQYAPGGWIQTKAWNMLVPLKQGGGCGGGGAATMAGNWVAPHRIDLEDPKAGDVWADIDFGNTALATGYGVPAELLPAPTWVSNAWVEAALGLPPGALPNGDVVDYQGLVDWINGNVIPGIPGATPLQGDDVLGIATTYVANLTGAPLFVGICTASDDSIQVWVNNVRVTNRSVCRGTAGDCDEKATAILPPGISRIATLVWEGGGGWGFRLAIEIDGAKVTDGDPRIQFLGTGFGDPTIVGQVTPYTETGPVGIFDGTANVGDPEAPTKGWTTFDGTTYTMYSCGADIWTEGDTFHFAYKQVTGDFVAIARVTSREASPEGWGRHGLMARRDLTFKSKFSMATTMLPLADGSVNTQPRHYYRVSHGDAGSVRNDNYILDDGIFTTEGRNPKWMKLVRRGRAIYSYMSEDAGGVPAKWTFVGSDNWLDQMPDTLYVGMASQSRRHFNLKIQFDKVSIEPLGDECVELDPISYETSATSTAGIGSVPYRPILVTARIPQGADAAAKQADARANGGSGFGVKNRNWVWTDLTAGSENLEGTVQLLWNNENRNFANAQLDFYFKRPARVYIAWDNRHVKGGQDNPNGTVDNGWFDFNNDVGTFNKQGWLRLTARSDDATPLAEEIRTDGDAAFARGGVWAKDVLGGTKLTFLATGFTAGRSPYVVFVRCLDQGCVAADELAKLEYSSDADLGVVVQGGDFRPAVVDGRLRLTKEGVGGIANAVWYGVPDDPAAGGVPLLDQGFVVEFDAYMSHSGSGNPDFNPADGMTFAVVATGVSAGLLGAVAPFPPGLDIASLRGDGGGALAYDGYTLRQRIDGHPSFAIELDNWVGGGEPANEPEDGGAPNYDRNWHVGLDVSASVSSLQTNVDLGVPTSALPDIFNPNGVHVEVMYTAGGEVKVWVSGTSRAGNIVPRTQVISARIPSLPRGDVVLGFTGATGGATCNQDIDNLRLRTICCEQPDAVQIAGPATFNQGGSATYKATLAGAELGGPVTYAWSIVSGQASLSTASGPQTELSADVPGDVVLRVEANDGTCASAAAEVLVKVIPLTCDIAIACTPVEGKDTVKISVASATPPACACDEIALTLNGAEIFRGTIADMEAREFQIPPECGSPDAVVYAATCAGPLGEGKLGTCEVPCPSRSKPFIRGDCNQDGEVCRQVSDMVTILMICFFGELPTPACPAACDANGDGRVCGDLSDVLYLANYCFTGLNEAPPAPYPDCGVISDAPCDGPTFCSP